MIQEGPVLYDRSASLLTSTDLSAIQGSWEEPIIQMYLDEREAKSKNVIDALIHINRHYPGKGKILDVGCFCGLFLNAAKEAGWECQGIEPLVMPSIYARGYYHLNIITDTLKETSFPENEFDVITYFQVIEHLPAPDLEIRKIKKILKPGGLLVIEVPNIDTPLVSILRTRHRHFVPDHISFFSKDTLRKILEPQGFRIVETYYPTRVLSLGHILHWGKRNSNNTESAKLALAGNLLGKEIRLNLHDIVTVIARKL